jgi:hypothetical protein
VVPAGGAVLGGSGDFGRWGTAGGNKSLDDVSWGYSLSYSLCLLPVCYEVSSISHILYAIKFCLVMGPESMEPRTMGRNSETMK